MTAIITERRRQSVGRTAISYWLGPVPWYGDHYAAPRGVTGWIDLRSIPQCAAPNRPGDGFGFYVAPSHVNLGSEYTKLSGRLRPKSRNVAAHALGLAATTLSTPLGVLYDALTRQADPSGEVRCKPLAPTIDLHFEVWLAGRCAIRRPFNAHGPESLPLQRLLRRDYRQMRHDSINGKYDSHYRHLKVLGGMVEKYGLHYRWFQCESVPDERPKKPETTWTETWPTNGAITSGQDQTWTYVGAGTSELTVQSNALGNTSGTSVMQAAKCSTSLSSADHYCQAENVGGTPATTTRQHGPACRMTGSYSGTDLNLYTASQHGGASSNGSYEIGKFVYPTYTALGTPASEAQLGVKKIYASGSTIKRFHAGSELESITDSSISSGVNCGSYGNLLYDNFMKLDNFEAADLAAGGPSQFASSLALLGAGR